MKIEEKEKMQRRAQYAWGRMAIALSVCLALAGCGRSPTFSILGSYFPAWLVCIVIGIALAALVNLVLTRIKREYLLAWPGLVYPCLAALFSFTIWLLFFS